MHWPGVTLSIMPLGPAFLFAVGSTTDVRVTVEFDGFLPVFGGKVAKASVAMTVRATGATAADGTLAVESRISALEVKLNGALMPMNEKNVTTFFPIATATFDPRGRVKSNTAPNVPPLVRLPGLDARRLPEISYLPLELPDSEFVVGAPYTFHRAFSGSDVEYVVTPMAITPEGVRLRFTFKQSSISFEDDRANLVEEAKAKVKVVASFTGLGSAVFSPAKGRVTELDLTGESVDDATLIATSQVTHRKLASKLSIRS